MKLILAAGVLFGALSVAGITAAIWTAESFGLSDKLGGTGFVAFALSVIAAGLYAMWKLDQ